MKIIVIENDEQWIKRTVKNIDKVLTKNNIEEKIILFYKYTEKLKNIIYDNSEKIYILDIDLGEDNGFQIAKEIRDDANDWKSIIIISSIYNQKESIISERLAILTYISKLVNFDTNMKTSVELAIKILTKDNFLEFKENGINHKIVIDNIIYIKKEKYSKYCIIKTTNNSFRIRNTIANLKEKTGFTQIRKDILINKTC